MKKVKILVVEDEGIVALDLQIRLKRLGYAVPATTDSGQSAIEKVAETCPDLVLMDIRLKGEMDGFAAAHEIQTRFDIPVVYLTALVDRDTVQQAETTRPYGYILKPFEDEELQTTIETALNQHQVKRSSKSGK